MTKDTRGLACNVSKQGDQTDYASRSMGCDDGPHHFEETQGEELKGGDTIQSQGG